MKKIALCCMLYFLVSSVTNAQTQVYSGGSLFGNGFARVLNKERSFYIDTTGKYAFDWYYESVTYYNETLPFKGRKVIKGNKYGIIADSGRWILPAIYDKIEKCDSISYLVYQNGKADLYIDQHFLFGFQFQDIKKLKEDYYAVKQNGKWGVYLKPDKKFVVPALYNEFDYCFGCDSLGNYVYARKGDNWGVVSFKNEELLPFKYEYTQIEKRSDEWVTSFVRNGKHMVVNIYTKAETICPDECDCEDDFDWGFKRIKSGDNYGLVNTQGKLILDTVYSYINRFAGYHEDTANPYIIIRKDDLYGIADSTGKIIATPVYSNWPKIYNNHLFALEKDSMLGIADESGKMIMPFKFKYIGGIYGDSLVLGSDSENENTMLYRMDGTPLFADAFQSITKVQPDSTTSEFASLFSIERNDKIGFYNAVSGAFIDPQYDYTSFDRYSNNGKRLIEVRKDTVYGLIDENGVAKMPVEYTYLRSSLKGYNDWVRGIKGDKEILFNIKAGKEALSVNGSISQLEADSSLLLVQEITNDGNRTRDRIVSVTGETIVPAKGEIVSMGNDFAIQCSENLVDGFNLINYKTRSVTPLPYKNVWTCFNPSLLIVEIDSVTVKLLNVVTGQLLVGEYDLTTEHGYYGDKIIPGVSGFVHSCSIVTQKGKQGIIDSLGNIVIPSVYDNVELLTDRFILLQKKQTYISNDIPFTKMQYGFGDITGRVIIPVQYDMPAGKMSRDLFTRGYFTLVKRVPDQAGNYYPLNEKWGIADTAGNILFEPTYDNIVIDEEGDGFIVQQDDKWGIVNKQGKVIVPCKYDDIAYVVNGYYRENLPLRMPAMVKKGDKFRYVQDGGKELSIEVKEIITYYPSVNEIVAPPVYQPKNKKTIPKKLLGKKDIEIVAPPVESNRRYY
ncbi:MAG: WG repeat-containing protein [Filimonas sp.]|nr:WG repeat-containing protein [Filimonas sp.]